MGWQIIIGIVVAVPLILAPVAFIWFLSYECLATAIREHRSKKTAHTDPAGLKAAVR
jgi:hypothetical protein